ncbi:hypothetical protein EYF80_048168 [Liparis tanakae]|uniref:Uncharacterized protein n=1 Tax=Liparis tanakae TaxID=230148 RepID=A0A4Z2FL97_9TELE|nr:hypothetical protein EYF80_048168 [Liparis tanakae]
MSDLMLLLLCAHLVLPSVQGSLEVQLVLEIQSAHTRNSTQSACPLSPRAAGRASGPGPGGEDVSWVTLPAGKTWQPKQSWTAIQANSTGTGVPWIPV